MPFPFSFPPLSRRFSKGVLTGLLILLFGAAAWARFRLPLAPISDPDIWCYFNPALSKLLGGAFQHTYGQCFLYPGLIWVILAAAGDFRWITAVQHFLGLGTGVLLLVAWRQARSFLPRPRVPSFVYDLMGLAMAGMFLLSPSPVGFEHTLRPESVFPFFVILNVCLNLAFIRRRFHVPGAGGDGRTVAAGAGAVFVCVMAWLLKPSFSVMLLLANLPVICSLFLPGASWRAKTALALAPTLAAGGLLVLPEWHFRRGDRDAHSFLALSLFTVHANLIRDQMKEDLARHRAAPYDPAWLADVRDHLTAEIRQSAAAGHYLSLGFNPDYLKEERSFIGWLVKRLDGDRERTAFFCDDWYERAWHGRPSAMLQKIASQLGVFYRFGPSPVYRKSNRYDLKREYVRSAIIFNPNDQPFDGGRPPPGSNLEKVTRYPPSREYLAQAARWARESIAVTAPGWVRSTAAFLAITYFPLCMGALALGAAASVSRAIRRWGGPAIGVLLLLYAYNFGVTLALSIGHSMSIGRYSTYQLAFTVLAQGIGLWLAAEIGLVFAAWLAARARPLLAAEIKPLPLPPVDGEVFLFNADGADAEELQRAYRSAPADLIVFAPLPPGPLLRGPRLLSSRLRRELERRPADGAGALAAGRGFAIRELPEKAAMAKSPIPGRWARMRQLLRWVCVYRPVRSFAAIGMACLLLAAGLGFSAVHRRQHARHRYASRRAPAVAAVGLAALALGALPAGCIMENRRRRWREEFLRRP